MRLYVEVQMIFQFGWNIMMKKEGRKYAINNNIDVKREERLPFYILFTGGYLFVAGEATVK